MDRTCLMFLINTHRKVYYAVNIIFETSGYGQMVYKKIFYQFNTFLNFDFS